MVEGCQLRPTSDPAASVSARRGSLSAMVVGITSLPQPAELTLDRPFLFIIQHEPTGAILFAGVVANPAG